ncbi:hypothetical protein D9M72_594680 [compost metagenome]
MKWLPDPSEPSWSSHFATYWPGSNLALAASLPSSAIRGSAVAVILRLLCPADSGITRSMASRSRFRSGGRSVRKYCVLTAIMPQPMSTPTAAGITASRVGMTDPTVAPFPRWASGISARCG